MLRVTTIVSEVYASDLATWELEMLAEGIDPAMILDVSSRMGTVVHDNLEGIDKLAPEQQEYARAAFKNLLAALKETGFQITDREIEVTYVGEEGVYIGHIDWLGLLEVKDEDGEKWLIDIKTHGLWKYMIGATEFKGISSQQKSKVNLQTWLYKKAGNGSLDTFKRGVLVVNHLGWEFIELKREPLKAKKAHAMQVVQNYSNIHNF